eukprot:TRINITY_DN61069_c0_g1_i2.p1 TRINITY_DN61069_c0_g1~~TRINITY_DN61069_c0_g1_i2.p1  ORF type:complete len:120 (+),score=4.78 TRINITY_DN61069_c0_g1_i2:115-474(+)
MIMTRPASQCTIMTRPPSPANHDGPQAWLGTQRKRTRDQIGTHVYHHRRATCAIGQPKQYVCKYCGYSKTCSSGSSDGVVRIRCPCGGVKADGVNRMHAAWTPLGPGPHPHSLAHPHKG